MKSQRQGDSPSARRQRQTLLRYAGMGVELAAAIVGLTLLGLWIDRRFDTQPTFLLIGAGLGLVGGFYNFIRQALRLERESTAQARSEHPPEDDEHDQ